MLDQLSPADLHSAFWYIGGTAVALFWVWLIEHFREDGRDAAVDEKLFRRAVKATLVAYGVGWVHLLVVIFIGCPIATSALLAGAIGMVTSILLSRWSSEIVRARAKSQG